MSPLPDPMIPDLFELAADTDARSFVVAVTYVRKLVKYDTLILLNVPEDITDNEAIEFLCKLWEADDSSVQILEANKIHNDYVDHKVSVPARPSSE